MSYRDDLEAAHQRVAALERECAELRRQMEVSRDLHNRQCRPSWVRRRLLEAWDDRLLRVVSFVVIYFTFVAWLSTKWKNDDVAPVVDASVAVYEDEPDLGHASGNFGKVLLEVGECEAACVASELFSDDVRDGGE